MSESEAGMDTKKRKEHSSLESKALLECLTRKHAERGGVGTPTKRLTLASWQRHTRLGGTVFFFFFLQILTAYFRHIPCVLPLASSAKGR